MYIHRNVQVTCTWRKVRVSLYKKTEKIYNQKASATVLKKEKKLRDEWMKLCVLLNLFLNSIAHVHLSFVLLFFRPYYNRLNGHRRREMPELAPIKLRMYDNSEAHEYRIIKFLINKWIYSACVWRSRLQSSEPPIGKPSHKLWWWGFSARWSSNSSLACLTSSIPLNISRKSAQIETSFSRSSRSSRKKRRRQRNVFECACRACTAFAGQISRTIQSIKIISKQENDDDNYDKRHV